MSESSELWAEIDLLRDEVSDLWKELHALQAERSAEGASTAPADSSRGGRASLDAPEAQQ